MSEKNNLAQHDRSNSLARLDRSHDLAQLDYVLLRGAGETGVLRTYHEKAYALWRDVWKQTFQELNGDNTLFANDFTRQDEVGALFQADRCLMLSFFRRCDLGLSSSREDSYFKAWTPTAFAGLGRDGTDIVVGSNITLAPEARGKNFFLPLKDLVLSLSVKYLLESGADAMTGTTRNDRGVNSAAARVGGVLLEANQNLHGVPVDLMAFYARDIRSQGNYHLKEIADELWRRRISYQQRFAALKAA